jgi:hypothetical protein
MAGFKCGKCNEPATHRIPLSGDGPLGRYRCARHKGPNYSVIPGVLWPRPRIRSGRRK